MLSPEHYTEPLYREIRRLRDILAQSPTSLMVPQSDNVLEMVGYGDRIIAMEVVRLREALEKIANGAVSQKDSADFAESVLEGTRHPVRTHE